uniref:Uncharacterized protein n=1 Tax=Anguilla anguilla TaxID=7936 RepID=A0A0E9WR60_ANGAN
MTKGAVQILELMAVSGVRFPAQISSGTTEPIRISRMLEYQQFRN